MTDNIGTRRSEWNRQKHSLPVHIHTSRPSDVTRSPSNVSDAQVNRRCRVTLGKNL